MYLLSVLSVNDNGYLTVAHMYFSGFPWVRENSGNFEMGQGNQSSAKKIDMQ